MTADDAAEVQAARDAARLAAARARHPSAVAIPRRALAARRAALYAQRRAIETLLAVRRAERDARAQGATDDPPEAEPAT